MDVQVDVRAAEVLLKLRNGSKRMAYAVSKAMNDTAVDAQQAIYGQVRERFQIRKPGFFFAGVRAAGRVKFASPTQGRAEARITIGGTDRVLLPGFEAGAERKPFTPGAKEVAVPVLGRPARPSIAGPVPPAYTFRGLRLKLARRGARRRSRAAVKPSIGTKVFEGLQRTYEIAGVGVFQRIGKALRDTRLIWSFVAPFRLDRRLRAGDTAEGVIRRRFPLHLAKQIDETIRFNRGR